jgi:hypothetical protein
MKSLHPKLIKTNFGHFRAEFSTRRRKDLDAGNALHRLFARLGIRKSGNRTPGHTVLREIGANEIKRPTF